MYDDWSDDKRLEILFSYETEIINFIKKLISRGRKKEAEKLLKKAEKIIPHSDEVKQFLTILIEEQQPTHFNHVVKIH